MSSAERLVNAIRAMPNSEMVARIEWAMTATNEEIIQRQTEERWARAVEAARKIREDG